MFGVEMFRDGEPRRQGAVFREGWDPESTGQQGAHLGLPDQKGQSLRRAYCATDTRALLSTRPFLRAAICRGSRDRGSARKLVTLGDVCLPDLLGFHYKIVDLSPKACVCRRVEDIVKCSDGLQ